MRARGFTLIEMIVFIVIVGVALLGVMAGFRATQERSSDPLFVVRANELAYIYLEEIMSRPYDEFDTEDSTCSDKYFGSETGCTPWADFGPDGVAEVRANFDDVDDYHLLVDGSERIVEGGATEPNPACTGFADIVDPTAPETDRQAALGPNVHPSGDGYYTANPTPFPLDAEGNPRADYDEFCVEVTVHYDGDYDGVPNTDGSGTRAKRVRIRVSHPFTATVIVSAYRASF